MSAGIAGFYFIFFLVISTWRERRRTFVKLIALTTRRRTWAAKTKENQAGTGSGSVLSGLMEIFIEAGVDFYCLFYSDRHFQVVGAPRNLFP